MTAEEKWYLSNATMAMLLLSVSYGKNPNDINELSKQLATMKNRGINIGDITVSRGATGYYSEQLDRFLGSFLVAGDAERRSPVKLKESGVSLCKQIVSSACDRDRATIENIASALNFELRGICQ